MMLAARKRHREAQARRAVLLLEQHEQVTRDRERARERRRLAALLVAPESWPSDFPGCVWSAPPSRPAVFPELGHAVSPLLEVRRMAGGTR